MENKVSCIFNWSGGKDSALALYHCLKDPLIDIKYLVTTINGQANRISMHGVREELLIFQAQSIGIPLFRIRLPEMPGMAEYDACMAGHLRNFRDEGITHSIFGDIFLQDLRDYREARLKKAGLNTIFPLWKRDTGEVVNEFLDLGFRTVISCARHDLEALAGKELSRELIADFPPDVDVCGENGEFHTFVYDGPFFHQPVPFRVGEKVFKEYNAPQGSDPGNGERAKAGFWYADLF